MNIINLYSGYKRILIIGPYPPPLGGISIFIYRLKQVLRDHNFKVDIFDTSKNYIFFGIKYLAFFIKIIFNNYQVIHIQHFDLKKTILLFALRHIKKYKVFYTDHNPFLFENKNKIVCLLNKRLLGKLDLLIVVNDHILDIYNKHGVVLPKNYLIQNAFLPPPIEEENKILNTYPNGLFDFLKEHKPLVIANAFQLRLINNIDLYGFDICVDLVKKLKPYFPQIGFIFALANEKYNDSYLREIQIRINKSFLNENFYFLTGQKELWPLFRRVDLFIRATYKDGYGISIDEALYFKCSVLASNVCKRNNATTLFENRNLDDLFNKSLNILKKQYHCDKQ